MDNSTRAYNYDKVWALIPARSGSKGVPHKNIRDFYGYPLIAYSIASALMCKEIDRVIVSTDSEEIANIASHYGADVPFLRPLDISGDKSTDLEFVEHAISWFLENEGFCAEFLVHLRPTTPVRNPYDIGRAIKCIKSDKNSTSLRSAHRCIHPPYKWFKSGDGSYWDPLMAASNDEANNPRQEFPDVFIPNGYVDILKADYVLSNHLIHGDRMIGFVTDEVQDIDTENDFKKIDQYPNSKESFYRLREFLRKIKNDC